MERSGLLRSKKDVSMRRVGKMENALFCGPEKSQCVEEREFNGIGRHCYRKVDGEIDELEYMGDPSCVLLRWYDEP